MATLTSLSTELKILIIENLRLRLIPHKPSSSRHPRRKKRHLGTKRLDNLVNLSYVNRELRGLVAPYLFRDITLRNTYISGESVQAVAEGTHAEQVNTIHYAPLINNLLPKIIQGQKQPPADFDQGQLKGTVKHVLESLSKFPNLVRLTIEFVITDENIRSKPEVMDLFAPPGENGPETVEQVSYAEKKEGWRALMKQSYDAIVRNDIKCIKSLELRNLVPKGISTWREPAWHLLLNGLESFTLTLRGSQDGFGGSMPIHEEYSKLLMNIGVYFFNHLSNVTYLRFEATADGPVGCQGTLNHTPFYFTEKDMPKLRSLNLAYVFLSKQLLDGICGHRATLETIRLTDCVGLDTVETREPNPNEITWAELFDGVRNANIVSLKDFVVEWVDMPTENASWEEHFSKFDGGEEKRRAFVYGLLAHKFGDFYIQEEDIAKRFEEREDSRAWEELQSFVAENSAERGTLE